MKTKRSRCSFASVVLLTSTFALVGQVTAKGKAKSSPASSAPGGSADAVRRPSTSAERAEAAKAARELEVNPIGPGAEVARKLAKRVLEAPDIQVKICANMLASFVGEKSPRHDELLLQLLFSTMAFMIEEPSRANDDAAAYQAGVVGALRAYRRIRSAEPGSRSPFFDKLADQQDNGKLDAYLGREIAACLPPR